MHRKRESDEGRDLGFSYAPKVNFVAN